MTKTETPDNDALRKAAELLTSEPVVEVAKAAEVTDVAPPAETPDLAALVEAAVSKALSPILEQLGQVTEIQKSLTVLAEDSSAIRTYQHAATEVLINLKKGGDEVSGAVSELKAVTKSIQVEVAAQGNQPAAPRSVVVAETAPVTPATPALVVNEEALSAITKSMETWDAVTVNQFVSRGQLDKLNEMLTPDQRKKVFKKGA